MKITEQDINRAVVLTSGGIGIIKSFTNRLQNKVLISNLAEEYPKGIFCDEFGWHHEKEGRAVKVLDGFVGVDSSERIQELELRIESLERRVEFLTDALI